MTKDRLAALVAMGRLDSESRRSPSTCSVCERAGIDHGFDKVVKESFMKAASKIAMKRMGGIRNVITRFAAKATSCASIMDDEDFFYYFKIFMGTQMMLCCLTVGLTLWHFSCS